MSSADEARPDSVVYLYAKAFGELEAILNSPISSTDTEEQLSRAREVLASLGQQLERRFGSREQVTP